MVSTYPHSTILSASNLKVHFPLPGGGSLQARANKIEIGTSPLDFEKSHSFFSG